MSGFAQSFALTFLGTGDRLTGIVTLAAYVVLGVWAYRKFNRLEIAFEASDFSPTAQSWTTDLRFFMAAFVYVAVYLGMFRIAQEYPQIREPIQTQFPGIGGFMGDMEADFPWLSPAVTAAVLIGLMELPKVRGADALGRGVLQRMAAIPRRVQFMMRELANAEIERDSAWRSDADFPFHGRLAPGAEANQATLEDLAYRTWYLDQIIGVWLSDLDRSFGDFAMSHRAPFEAMRAEYGAAAAEVATAIERRERGVHDAEGDDRCLGRLKRLYECQRGAMACGFLRKGLTPDERRRQMLKYGLRLRVEADRLAVEEVLAVMRNDVVLVLLTLVFVAYPLAVLLARTGLGWKPEGNSLADILFLWPLMIFCFCAATLLPALMLRPGDVPAMRRGLRLQRLPWLASLGIGLVAAAGGAISLSVIQAATSPVNFVEALDSLVWYAPFGFFLGGGISLMLSLRYFGRWQALLEGLALGVVAGIFGFLISLGGDPSMTIERVMRLDIDMGGPAGFTVIAMFVIAFTIGAILPSSFRRNFPRATGAPDAAVGGAPAGQPQRVR